MRAAILSLFVAVLMTACTSQPQEAAKAEKETPRNQQPVASSCQLFHWVPPYDDSGPLPDSLCARLGPCPIKFRYLNEADLQRILASDSGEVTTVLENYFLVGHNPVRFIYQLPGETKRWVETYVGVTGNRLGDRLQSSVGLDTARLGKSSVPVVILRVEATRSDHLIGGATRCVSIISVAKEPVLLLKAEDYDVNWRIASNEADTNDSALDSTEDDEAGEDMEQYICQQSIEVRDKQIVIGQVKDENDKVVEPTIAALPAGKYQYQNGQLLRASR